MQHERFAGAFLNAQLLKFVSEQLLLFGKIEKSDSYIAVLEIPCIGFDLRRPQRMQLHDLPAAGILIYGYDLFVFEDVKGGVVNFP